MEHFHQLQLDAYLTDIKHYLHPSAVDIEREEFIKRIYSIPNVQTLFMDLAKANPKWIELTNGTAPLYYVEKRVLDREKPLKEDELSLCIFDMGKQPVIKITTYIQSHD